jgi:hypothetical protein
LPADRYWRRSIGRFGVEADPSPGNSVKTSLFGMRSQRARTSASLSLLLNRS